METVCELVGVRRRGWSKAEYYRLGELGFFHGQRVELLEGDLVVLSPQGAPHFSAVEAVFDTLYQAFGTGYRVRSQGPLDLGQTSEPEPDVAVVVGRRVDYRQDHPTAAVLVVEVSDTTLAHDRGRKGSLYARAGVADYWVVNLVDRQVEVYRDPVPDAAQPYGFRYASRTDHVPPSAVAPLALPGVAVGVAELLG